MARTDEEIKQRRQERYLKDKLNPEFRQKLNAEKREKYKENSALEIERRTQYFVEHPEKYLLTTIKSRCKRDNITFNLTEKDFNKLPTHCPVFNVPLERNLGKRKWSKYALSVDKIQPDLGYVSGNIQILSRLANNMKSEATPEELLKFADWIYATYKKEG